MENDTNPTDADRQYAAAYAAHYTARDLPIALRLYLKIMESHPDTQEAGYSRAQILNIANTIVPEQELLDANVGLLFAHFKQEAPPDVSRIPVSPLASNPTT